MLSISLAWDKIGKPYSDFPKNTFGGRGGAATTAAALVRP